MKARSMFGLLLVVGASWGGSAAQANSCAAPSAVKMPPLYSVGWIPWLGDLKSWRNYDPTTIPGIGDKIGDKQEGGSSCSTQLMHSNPLPLRPSG